MLRHAVQLLTVASMTERLWFMRIGNVRREPTMCPQYVVNEDEFGANLGEYCQLAIDLLYQFGIRKVDDSEQDSDEDIPY